MRGTIVHLCIHYLHRHPIETPLPLSAIIELAAYDELTREAND